VPRYKAKNSVTGEEVYFDWDNPQPPSEEDISRISDQQRAGRIKVKEQIAKNEPGPVDRLLMHPATGVALKAADVMGFNQPWHPFDSAKEAASGVGQMFTGAPSQPGQQYPRVAGAVRAVRGALGVVGPPATALGYAIAPEITAPAMAVGNVASEGVRQALSNVQGLPPEVSDAISTGVGLIAGGITAHSTPRAAAPAARPLTPSTPPIVDAEFTAPPRQVTPSPQQLTPPSRQIAPPPRQLPPVNPIDIVSRTRPGPIAPSELPTAPGSAPRVRIGPAPIRPQTPQLPGVQPLLEESKTPPPPLPPPARLAPVKPPLEPVERPSFKGPINISNPNPIPDVTPEEFVEQARPITTQMRRAIRPSKMEVVGGRETATQEAPEVGKVSSGRQQKIQMFQQLMDSEEDPVVKQVMQDHLESEQRNAQIESRGSPEEKGILKDLDEMYQRLDELESKEDSGETLTEEEHQEIRDIYSKASRTERQNPFRSFFESERGVQERRWGLRWRMNPVPEPGRATPRDIRAASAEFGSANQVLSRSGLPGATEIGDMTPMVESNKHSWVGTRLRQVADVMKPYSREARLEANDVLDGVIRPQDASQEGQQLASYLRGQLDDIFNQFPAGAKKSGKDVNYRKDYATHMKRVFEGDDWFSGVFDDLMSPQIGLLKATKGLFTREPIESMKGTERPLEQHGVKEPSSPYVETRTGQMKDYELDPKYWFPRYVESASKVIFDKPWIDRAKGYLNQIPDEAKKAKDLATWYLRNYARYDAYPGLEQAMNSFTRELMRTNAQTLLGLDTRLWGLHASRLMANIFPEVPMKYFAHGLAKTVQHPIESYDEVGRLGMLPNTLIPEYFKPKSQRVASFTNAYSIADALPDSVAYQGLKKMYMDQGETEPVASRLAIEDTKNISMRVTPARVARFFTRGGPLQPLTQFKQQIFKIVENYTRLPSDALRDHNFGKLMKYLVGVGAAIGAYKKLHIATWHLNPLNLYNFAIGSSAYGNVAHIVKKAYSTDPKDWGTALGDLGLFFTPGGTRLKEDIQKGHPSFLEDVRGPEVSGSLP